MLANLMKDFRPALEVYQEKHLYKLGRAFKKIYRGLKVNAVYS